MHANTAATSSSHAVPIRTDASRGAATTAALILLLVAPVFLFGYVGRYTQSPDPFLYAQLAKEVLSGRRLYGEAWQDKPPLAYVMYGLPQLIVPRSYGAITIFAGLCVSFTSALCAFVFRRRTASMLAVAMFLSLFPMTYWDYIWPSTELFSNVYTVVNLFLGMMIYQTRRYTLWQCLVIGIVSCLAFHARQNAFFSVLIPVIAMWRISPHDYGRLTLGLACVVLGGGLCWSVILAIIYRIGDLPMYFWTVFVYPTSYAATGNVADFVQLWSHLWTSPLPMFIAVFGGVALYRRDDRWMVASLIAVGLFAASFPRRPHAHYWVCSFPYVALLIGIGIQRMSELSSRLEWTLVAAVAAVLLPAPVLQLYITRTFYNQHGDLVALAEEVDRLAPENGTLFTCGTGQFEAIPFASRLMPASTFQWTLQMNEPYVGLLPRSLDEIFADYVAHPPDMIVAPRVMLVAAAAEPEPPNLGVEARLLRTLTKNHQYGVAGSRGDYIIARRVAAQAVP